MVIVALAEELESSVSLTVLVTSLLGVLMSPIPDKRKPASNTTRATKTTSLFILSI